ncbi:hypothetical protein CSHISOI_03231 [Colletotrichum shisoi]|uniref:Uncharacterized protein n=1 Tax=Colletotrichum shisoi TaxID=2078593 RepID=A0A5Q4BZ02_9PEZI|nr:hypothetical protein CSHISOI_03231 [Colletotrichum shisoi]
MEKHDQVVSAVLVDGGIRGDDHIVKTIEEIMTRYDFTGSSEEKFLVQGGGGQSLGPGPLRGRNVHVLEELRIHRLQDVSMDKKEAVFYYLPATSFPKKAKDGLRNGSERDPEDAWIYIKFFDT